MGIFDRLSTVLRSNMNDLISSAENPEKMLNQIIIDMRSQLTKAKQQVAASIADERRLRDQVESEYKLAKDWEGRAMLAVQEGRDDLARQALVRHNEHLQHAQTLDNTWRLHQEETEKLKGSLREMNDRIEEAKRKKNLLMARQKRADAQKRIQETMSSMSDKSAFEAFNRMEAKIEDNERRLIASAQIDEEFSGDALQREFKQLETGAAANDADMQLLELKQKMGMLSSGSNAAAQQRIGAGRRDEEMAHAEIEDATDDSSREQT